MAGRCLQKMVYSIDIFLVMMAVMVHDSLGGSGGSACLPRRLEQGTQLREVVELEQQAGIKVKIVETGGRTIKSLVQNSNPTASPGCLKTDCLACQDGRGEGGKCRQSNVNYSMLCKLCPESNPTEYIGETARNLYTRCREHIKNSKSKKSNDSFVKKHQVERHAGAEAQFSAKARTTFRDRLSIQVGAAVATSI